MALNWCCPVDRAASSVGWSEQSELQRHPTFTVARFGMTRHCTPMLELPLQPTELEQGQPGCAHLRLQWLQLGGQASHNTDR